MEQKEYVSYIKINGVPILPPMMTTDVKNEMFRYKQTAISVEKKLAALHVAKGYNNYDIAGGGRVRYESKDTHFEERMYSPMEDLVLVESKNVGARKADISTETLKNSKTNREESLQCSKCLEEGTNLTSDTSSETVSSMAETELVSNAWKPQVPKTLNVIPLTVSNSNYSRNGEREENSFDSRGDTPKLVRQGSYVLDAPSPILLAHMQMKLTSSNCTPCLEYIPTSYSNRVDRNEWNMVEGKIEWEHETESKDSSRTESWKSLSMEKNSRYLNRPIDRTLRRSLSLQTKTKSSFASTYPSTRSVDCIRTMLTEERRKKSDAQIDSNRRCNTNCSKDCNNLSTFDSMYRFGGSLESLKDINVFSKSVRHRYNTVSTEDNFITEMSKNISIRDSTSKSKSSAATATDKLLTVYKKVQEMHRKQMAELMSRQQREQTLLQQEFEKQQLLLLTEIRKQFPELSVSSIPENILSPAFNRSSSNDEKLFENVHLNDVENTKTLESNLQENNASEHSQKHNKRMILCPLEFIYPKVNDTVESDAAKSLAKIDNDNLVTKTEESGARVNNGRKYENELRKETNVCKRLNVSRQLFPLDSKTTHVPVPERTIYQAKHIEAANVINAYTRGYLVRRIMRTERVITLKNTYKEALHCMLKLHVDAPLNRSEYNFLQRLQLQCDAASMNIVELFAQSPEKRMQIIAQDREIKQSRIERPTSARSYSFATQRTLARKKLKEMEEYQPASFVRTCLSRSRCQTWTSHDKEKLISPNILYHSIKRSTSTGTVRKPWR